ncbi:MAG: nucleotide exchange factor GrpE [Firmicutes bacterium]|nr:nucleotide exchange factor GrpE [Bacillota bacterium]
MGFLAPLFMKNNQEMHQEREVSGCRCHDCTCRSDEKGSRAQEPSAAGNNTQEEIVDMVREGEGGERQAEEGRGGEGQVEKELGEDHGVEEGQEPDTEGAEFLDPEVIKDEVVNLRQRVEELTQQLVRLQADFDNYRKRSRRDLQEGIIRANEELVRELLPVLDNLERAIAVDSEASQASIREGVQLVYRQFLDILAKEGLEPIQALGEDFDPNLHEAVMVETVEDPEMENRILQEFQKGYTFRERVLRAAVVKVGKADN